MRKFICRILGHRYRLLREVYKDIREIECERCKQQFGMNDSLKVVIELTPDIKHLHNLLISEQLLFENGIYEGEEQ